MPDHFALLYVSDLAASRLADVVAGIARQARANNQRKDITGLLVFDGESFAQLVEGAESTILSLLERLKADTRHERVEVLQIGPSMMPRRFAGWRLGYLLLELHEFGIASLRGKQGPTAMEDFKLMLPALDMEAGDAVPKLLIRRGV